MFCLHEAACCIIFSKHKLRLFRYLSGCLSSTGLRADPTPPPAHSVSARFKPGLSASLDWDQKAGQILAPTAAASHPAASSGTAAATDSGLVPCSLSPALISQPAWHGTPNSASDAGPQPEPQLREYTTVLNQNQASKT